MLLITISISKYFILYCTAIFLNADGGIFCILFLFRQIYVTIVKALLYVNFLFNEEVGKPLHLPTSLIVNFSKIEDYFPPLYCVVKLGTGNFCFFMSAPFSLYFFITL